MDTFFEQIIVRRPSMAERIVKILMIVFGVLAILIMLFIAFMHVFGPISSFFVPVAFGVGVALYFALRNMYMEYEYSITNSSFDIDRIIGKRKRQRLLTTDCADFEQFGVYDDKAEQSFSHREFGARVFAANRKDEGLYYAVLRHKKIGTVLLVIAPDERIKAALQKFIPRQVQGNVLRGN